MRERLRSVIEDARGIPGRAFDFSVMALVFVSLVAFSVETLPDLSPSARHALEIVELVTVIFFTAEYVLRLYVAERRLGFVFSFFGIVDLLAVLPFYLGLGMDLRSIRALRLLRLFRALKLVRYSRAVRRFHRAFRLAKEEILLFLTTSLILLWLAAVGIYQFEHEAQPETFSSVFASLWWATTTLTTVGYGDAFPVTTGGRLFTFFVLAIGLGVVSVPSGLVASALSQARELEEQEKANAEASSDGSATESDQLASE